MDHKKVALLAKTMVDKTLVHLEKQRGHYGNEFAAQLSVSFLAALVGALTFRALKDIPEMRMTEDQLMKYQQENFHDMKSGIQDAVSAGVTGALTEFTGEQIDFYCLIREVPEAVNKSPC